MVLQRTQSLELIVVEFCFYDAKYLIDVVERARLKFLMNFLPDRLSVTTIPNTRAFKLKYEEKRKVRRVFSIVGYEQYSH